MMIHLLRHLLMVAWLTASVGVLAQQRQASPAQKTLADGFTQRSLHSKLVILPFDVELFAISGPGVFEPKAEWTQLAVTHITQHIEAKRAVFGTHVQYLTEADMAGFDELRQLHQLVATAIGFHHFGAAAALPTKNSQLNWSLGSAAVKAFRDKTAADYVMFTFVRDSYATTQHKVGMALGALLGVAIPGGQQLAYASLVDLQTGQISWFNRLTRANGDLRDPVSAKETFDALMVNFPPAL
jgi:hypothetical protein